MLQLYSFYLDAFWIAVKSILEHKLRAFLTLIGIIIGVAAVVIVGASISGLKTYVVDKVTKVLGANHFMITRLASTGKMSDDEFERKNRNNKDVTWNEYLYIRENCKNCLYVGAAMYGGSDLGQDGIDMPSVRTTGVTDTMYDIEDKTLAEGRFISADEVERGAAVVVIGTDVRDKFWPNTSPLGKMLKVKGVPCRVIGVEDTRGSFLGDSQDRTMYIPLIALAELATINCDPRMLPN